MSDLKSQVRELAAQIEAKKAEAGVAWKQFETLRESAKSEGVDFTQGDAFEKLDAAAKGYDIKRDEIAAMEAKRARLLEIVGEAGADLAAKGDIEAAAAATFGGAFVKSDAYRAFQNRLRSVGDALPVGNSDSVKAMSREEFKALVSVTVNPGLAPLADRTNLIVARPLAGLDFLQVINTATTDSDTVEWLEETTYTNTAAETAEGALAPESTVAFTKRSANVEEITHFIPMTRRAASDAAYVESWVNSRLIDGVRRRLQTQVLTGDGLGDNLAGIYGNAGIGSVDRSVTSTNMLESLHKAITTIRTQAFQEPDFIGIHPNDFETIRLTKADNSTYGALTYSFGDPASSGPLTAWGVPLIVHAAFTSGEPLVGVGREATLWVREGVSLSASDSHSDYFTRRQVALLAVMRVAFGVTQPKAFCKSVA